MFVLHDVQLLAAAVDADPYSFSEGMLGSVAYFVLAVVIFACGFKIQDWLTPGNYRQHIFINNLPNACVLAGSQAIALGIVIATAIAVSPADILAGLGFTAAYSVMGLVLQTLGLVLLEVFVPGRFRDVVEDSKLRPAVVLSGVLLIVIGVINAVCII